MHERTPLQPLLRHVRPLLLQGPMGTFFARLARFLQAQGQDVHKVNFNGGDELFYRRGATAYRGTPGDWPSWLAEYVRAHRIDSIVLFGQMRWMHERAMRYADNVGLPVYVFEEGYLRPDFVTLECGGVNGKSVLPRDAEFYRQQPHSPVSRAIPTRQRFRQMAGYAIAYYLAAAFLAKRYPHYRHHRPIQPLREAARWTRGGMRKLQRHQVERGVLQRLTHPDMRKRWFLLPLQVHNDSQVHHHSPFDSVEDLIATVIASFALHARLDATLVIKHHPMDRAYRNYAKHIERLARKHRIAKRVLYVHDQHLPTLLKNARGVVTLNSTVGLQALFHNTPVLTLGDCMYAVRGLVNDGPLDDFWKAPGTVDQDLYVRFRNYIVRNTQLNASFYGEAPALSTPCFRRAAPAAVTPREIGRVSIRLPVAVATASTQHHRAPEIERDAA